MLPNIIPNSDNIIRYNNQTYIVNIVLINTDGNVLPLNISSLESLVIEDDSEKWYKTATLIINNPDNILERKIADYPSYIPYKFRNDGRDFVKIQILPVIENNVNKLDIDQFFLMDYLFCIYDKDEITTGYNTKDKNLKLYLWEFEYQYLLEQNLEWSTNELLPTSIIPSQVSDEERMVYTGDAIKHLLNKGLDYSPQKFASGLWDRGSTKIFYSSFANNNCSEDLEYLLKKHGSTKTNEINGNEPCVLFRERYSKEWNLVPYSFLFSNASLNKTAGPLQREVFKLPSNVTENIKNIPTIPVLPNGIKVSFPVNSNIQNFEIVDMSALDNTTLMVDMPCYSNNIKNKAFVVDYKENTVESLKQFIQNNLTNKFDYNPDSKTLITLNKQKKQSKTLINSYSFGKNKEERYVDSRNLLLKSALFLNLSINFSVLGSSYRQSNTFIGIERQSPEIDNDFDKKLLGQWFVTKVIHNFTKKGYANNIIAVKVHSNNDLFISGDSV